jgi:hypothetical protein
MMTIIACASRVARGVGSELAGERPPAAVAA